MSEQLDLFLLICYQAEGAMTEFVFRELSAIGGAITITGLMVRPMQALLCYLLFSLKNFSIYYLEYFCGVVRHASGSLSRKAIEH